MKTSWLPSRLRPHVKRIRHAGAHIGYQALAALVPFLLLPVVTRYVTPDQYGQYALYMAVISFTSPLLMMGMDMVVTTDYFKHDALQRKTLISTYLVLLAVGLAGMETCMLAGHMVIERWLGLPFGAVMTLGVVAGLLCLMQLGQLVTMMEKRLTYQGLFIFGKVVISSAVSLPLIILVSATWDSLLWAQVASFSILAAAGLWFMYRHAMLGLGFSRPVAWEILTGAGPLIVFATSFNASMLVDRIIIKHFMALHDVGIYTMALMVLSPCMLFFLAISRVMWPWVSRNIVVNTREARLGVVRVIYIFWAGIVAVYLIAALCGGFVISLLTSEAYDMPLMLPPLLALSLMLNAILGFGLYFLVHAKRFAMITAISLTMLALAISLNILLIPSMGLPGTALANGFANLVGVTWCLTATFRTIDLPWREGALELRALVAREFEAFKQRRKH